MTRMHKGIEPNDLTLAAMEEALAMEAARRPAQEAALIELEELILRAAQQPGVECSVPYSDVCRIMTAIAGKPCYVSTG